MIWLGILMVLVGFGFVAPRGAASGSVANRNVRMGSLALVSTPGHQDEPSSRGRLAIRLFGVVMMVVGIAIIWVAG